VCRDPFHVLLQPGYVFENIVIQPLEDIVVAMLFRRFDPVCVMYMTGAERLA
jgi:hypothetical protein